MSEEVLDEAKKEREKRMTRIRVNKHRRAVSEAEGLVRSWAWWECHFNDPHTRPRAPKAHEQGHDDEMAPVTTRGRHDPQRLDPRFEAYLTVEKFVMENGGWEGNKDFLRHNSKKRYQIVLSGLRADGPRKEWYRLTILGLASACQDKDLPDVGTPESRAIAV